MSNPLLSDTKKQGLTTGIHRELLRKSLEPTLGWRYPLYNEYIKSGQLLQGVSEEGAGKDFHGFRKFISRAFTPYLTSMYIEWKYFSILSPFFHGIVGISLFNPRNNFSMWAEGGLLLLVAGTVNNEVSNEICWQKLFPTSSLNFLSEKDQNLIALSDDIELKIEHLQVNTFRITLKGPNAPEINLVHTGLENTSILPVLAEDLNKVPGSHWVVYNPSPIAQVDGSLYFSKPFLHNLPIKNNKSGYSFISQSLYDSIPKNGLFLELEKENGYYEHSFGMNPMPLFGWDFIFAPNIKRKSGLVMQTYKGSKSIFYVEVFWFEGEQQKYMRFNHNEFNIHWQKEVWHPDIRAKIPLNRTICGKKNGYTLSVKNEIKTHIPFLRQNKALVRNFFIAEDISVTSWTLHNAQGNLADEALNVLSGGETAFGRLYNSALSPQF